MQPERTRVIADLNDLCRCWMGSFGRVALSRGMAALGPTERAAIFEKVRTFEAFTPGDNPYGERGLWRLRAWGSAHRLEDRLLRCLFEYASEDPSDPRVTRRVLNILFAEEW